VQVLKTRLVLVIGHTHTAALTFHLPRTTVHLHCWGGAQCDGDIVVQLEKSRVIFLGYFSSMEAKSMCAQS
jgi:hypothetical protein